MDNFMTIYDAIKISPGITVIVNEDVLNNFLDTRKVFWDISVTIKRMNENYWSITFGDKYEN